MTHKVVGSRHPERMLMVEGSHLFPMEKPTGDRRGDRTRVAIDADFEQRYRQARMNPSEPQSSCPASSLLDCGAAGQRTAAPPLWVRLGCRHRSDLSRFLVAPTDQRTGIGRALCNPDMATVVSALFGGVSAGLLSTLLGMLLANFFMIAPLGQMAVKNPIEAFWLNLTFLVTQLVMLGAIWVMQQRNQRMQRAHATTRTSSQRKFQDTFEHAAAGISHVGLQGQLLDYQPDVLPAGGLQRRRAQSHVFSGHHPPR